MQRYKKSMNYARKKTDKSSRITPKQDKSRHITPNRASGSPEVRTFAVAKVLPLGLTDKKRFIARHSLKRTFAS